MSLANADVWLRYHTKKGSGILSYPTHTKKHLLTNKHYDLKARVPMFYSLVIPITVNVYYLNKHSTAKFSYQVVNFS